MRFLTVAKRLAEVGLVLLVIGPLGTRLGMWSFVAGFACFGLSALSGLIAVVLSLVGGFRTGLWPRAGLTTAAGLLLLAVPAVQVIRAAGAPPIHDITTDTGDPPQFVTALRLRAEAKAANSPDYGGDEIAAHQRRAYPDIQPVVMTMPPQQAFERVLAQVRELGWEVTGSQPAEGRIEAVDTTMFFAFKDDV